IISDINRAADPQDKYSGHLFSDYALLGKDGYPLAVVEAKKASRNAEEGKLQAVEYAINIQKNNPGKDMPFVLYTNGHEIHFWDKERYPPRKVYGFPARDDLERLRFLKNNSGTLSEELINTDISGRPYQIKAIRSVLESIQLKRRKFLLVMATGTGKTRVCVSLLDVLMRTNWDRLLNKYRKKNYLPIINFSTERGNVQTFIREKVLSKINTLVRDNLNLDNNYESAFSYLISEITDNIIEHSGVNRGWLLIQYYPTTEYLDLCIIDNGKTILGSY
ncbi:unnamed protein product, partial [marine sediment metagenome]